MTYGGEGGGVGVGGGLRSLDLQSNIEQCPSPQVLDKLTSLGISITNALCIFPTCSLGITLEQTRTVIANATALRLIDRVSTTHQTAFCCTPTVQEEHEPETADQGCGGTWYLLSP